MEAQGQVIYGGNVVDLGGGGDEPTPNPAGGGDSIRILTSCNNAACQFVEVGHNPYHARLMFARAVSRTKHAF